jgi:hypothetical protein
VELFPRIVHVLLALFENDQADHAEWLHLQLACSVRDGRITARPTVFSTTLSLMAECKDTTALVQDPTALVQCAYPRR